MGRGKRKPIKDQLETIRENLTKAKTTIFHPEARAYNDELDKFGWFYDLQVFTWSELRDEGIRDNAVLWERLTEFKVDGHCTNFPLELACFLRQKTLKVSKCQNRVNLKLLKVMSMVFRFVTTKEYNERYNSPFVS